MEDKDYKMITLGDGTKWLVIAQTIYENKTYLYALKVVNDDVDILNTVVMRVYNKDSQNYFDIVKDKEILKVIIPLLVPESREYINNPEMFKELIR